MIEFSTPLPVDLLASLRVLVTSAQDPTIRLRPDRLARAVRTPRGPASVETRQLTPDRFEARAWGPGADWVLAAAPGLVGAHDQLQGFVPDGHPLVARAHRRLPRMRLIRTGLVADVLVPTILAQRVTSLEAARSWTKLVRRFGEPAPGPHLLRLPPTAEQLACLPSWEWHRLGVERQRASTIARACQRLDRLEEAVEMPTDAAMVRLTALPGLGPWTAAIVRRLAAGDPDTVEVGDYHVKDQVSYALAGEPRGSDARMLELLAPFAGHRGRVVRLLGATAARPPSFGPRKRVVGVEAL